MIQTTGIWIVLIAALFAANLPFFTQRFLLLFAVKKTKTLGIHVLELCVFYFIAGGLGLIFEQRAGQIAPQGWEFYAITGTFFITFAFPGFIYRYLLNHRE